MISLLMAVVLIQNPTNPKAAPIEPKATTEADQKRLSQYPNLGGGLYNIDAVPEEGALQPPIPPAARDGLYWQKKAIATLSKRLTEADTILSKTGGKNADSQKAFKKLSNLFRTIERDFQLPTDERMNLDVGTPDVQRVASVIAQMRSASQDLKPDVVDLELIRKLARLANVAATMTDALALSARARPQLQR